MKRRAFVRSVGATVLAVPFASVFSGCGSAARALRASATNAKVTIPSDELDDLVEPSSFLKLYVDDMPNPIILFYAGNKRLRAVLSTCAHSGCEVRKMRTRFECPCHGSEYDLEGKVLKGPAQEGLDTFHVEEFPDRVEIILEQR